MKGDAPLGKAMILLLWAGSLLPSVARAVDAAPPVQSGVPRWDARGTAGLPWQGIASLAVSEDARHLAVGTISPPGDPNLLLLDDQGKIAASYRAGHRWLNDVTVSNDGRFVAALSTTPEGTAGDSPRLYAFLGAKELTQAGANFDLRNFRPAEFLFHYGDHSNHLPPVSAWAGDRWVVAGDDVLRWLSPGSSAAVQEAHLGPGMTTAFAASAGGHAVVGRYGGSRRHVEQGGSGEVFAGGVVVGRFDGSGRTSGSFPNLLVLEPGQPKCVAWSRTAVADVADPPPPEKGVYGPADPPYEDVRFQVPLSVAIDWDTGCVAAADYQGWQRVFHPRDGGEDVRYGLRFTPSRPTIHVYDSEGKLICRVDSKALGEAFWCDLAFSPEGYLFIWPHHWTSRGLAGQPFLPADDDARTIYILDVHTASCAGEREIRAGNKLLSAVQFPDAVSSVDVSLGPQIVVGCWNGKVYLLTEDNLWPARLPGGLDVGGPSLVRAAWDGERIAVATAAGVVRMLDAHGKQLWQTDLDRAARPGDKPWTQNQKAEQAAPGVWRSNGGLAHSDMGRQTVIEAPGGLILIDPNSAASLEQNWAKIKGAGLDPRQVKYVLLTHEHGDHAPGAHLWRTLTGAQVVAGAETAYILQHHIPGGTGYGFHPPTPVDIVLSEDQDLDLAGLKVRALRLPGHTSGSMGYAFQKNGRTYVATGDLIMPGGVLGYSGSLDFSAEDVLASLKKLAALRPDVVLGGHGGGEPDDFIARGIEAGEATGWSRMAPAKPDPFCRFSRKNYLVAAWLEPILSAAYGDVDGDGKPDVAVLVPKGKGSAVKVYLNKGGKFATAADAEIDLPTLGHAWKLRILHFGGGKAADFYAANESEALLLLSQPGQLKFRALPLPVTRGSQVATGDFLGRGKTDLLIGSRFSAAYSLAWQQEDGAFRVRENKVPGGYFDIALADVNGDGREDLITSCGDIFLRRPNAALAETPSFHLNPPPGEPQGWAFLAAADFDGDGRTDIAFLANGKEGTTVWLYRNTGNPRQPFPRQPSASFLVPGAEVNRDGPTVADFDGDGIPDLVLCSRSPATEARILTGSRADGLSPRRILSVKLDYVPHFDTRFGIADFDGDGKADLAGFGPSPTGAMGVYIWLQPGRGGR
jgi:glyoxylase-like metal-dependent hydrolase (beta-lactamase superfamily II)